MLWVLTQLVQVLNVSPHRFQKSGMKYCLSEERFIKWLQIKMQMFLFLANVVIFLTLGILYTNTLEKEVWHGASKTTVVRI